MPYQGFVDEGMIAVFAHLDSLHGYLGACFLWPCCRNISSLIAGKWSSINIQNEIYFKSRLLSYF